MDVWQDGWVKTFTARGVTATVYLGDCLEILPTLGNVDLLLTDPPYPNLKGGQDINKLGSGVGKRYQDSRTIGTPWGNSIEGVTEGCKKATLGAFSFCSFHSVSMMEKAMIGKPVALVTWYQTNAPPSIQNAPHFMSEYIWAFRIGKGLNWRKLKTVYDVKKLQAGCMATERLIDQNGRALHPTQKPVMLIYQLLQVGGQTVLDPYMGSGTTGIACLRSGRNFIGIEIDPKYYEIACERMAKECDGVLL